MFAFTSQQHGRFHNRERLINNHLNFCYMKFCHFLREKACWQWLPVTMTGNQKQQLKSIQKNSSGQNRYITKWM